MNPRELTLEQMEEREANRIAFQKAKAESAIAKLSARKENKNQIEQERLDRIIAIHTAYKEELDVTNVATMAMSKYNKIQEKISLREIRNK